MNRLLIATTLLGAVVTASAAYAADPPTILRGGRPAENPTVLRGAYGGSMPSTSQRQERAMACPVGYVLTDEGMCAATTASGGNRR